MPQHEFELYLKLLANLLDLAPSQREEIRDEMRDHLEERLAELAKLGVSREEAIERALDEFGDAAGLAGSFTKLARERQRRRFMYRTTGTAVAVTLTLLVAAALWPDGRANPVGPPEVVAQSAADPAAPDDATASTPAEGGTFPRTIAGSELRNEIEAALERPIEARFEDVPFARVVELIGDSIEVDILIDEEVLAEEGVSLDQPTTLVMQFAKPSARSVLELLLERNRLKDVVALDVRDGFVRITEIDFDALAVEVYNVRDLVGTAGLPGGAGGAGAMSTSSTGTARTSFVQMGGGGMGGGEMGGGGFFGGSSPPPPVVGIEGLVHVVRSTVAPSTWDAMGGSGTIAAFDGMIVVSNSADVHRRVRALLEKLREMGQDPASPVGRAAGRIPVRSTFGPDEFETLRGFSFHSGHVR